MKVVNLDFLIERPVEICMVEVDGEQYPLQAVKCVEDYLKLKATVLKVDELKTIEEGSDQIQEAMSEMRRLIRLFLPTMPDEKLRQLFPTMHGLVMFFVNVLMTVTENFPESVKKNCSTETKSRENHFRKEKRNKRRRRKSGR